MVLLCCVKLPDSLDVNGLSKAVKVRLGNKNEKYISEIEGRCDRDGVRASLGALLTLSLLLDRLIFRLAFEWLPAGGFLSRVVADYALSPVPILIALAVSLAASLVPPLIACARYQKQQDQLDRTIGGYADVSEKR